MKKSKKSDFTRMNDPATNLIRTKVDSAYLSEPSINDEKKEIASSGAHSKHQLFLKNLLSSNKSPEDTQAAWHNYYLNLDDNEKHDVWREFYALQKTQTQNIQKIESNNTQSSIKIYEKVTSDKVEHHQMHSSRTHRNKGALKKKILNKISSEGRLTYKHHLKSLLFGISLALFFFLVSSFTLFNQLFIAPFITPSINASSTPIIVPTSGTTEVSPEAKIIIPKLNIEAPIINDAADNQEETIQRALERGVVLYPNTGEPGELGNQVIFGHSSNNLFNRGDYKYVFALLGRLEENDIIYINYESVQYTYKVINKKIVKPTEVSVISEQPVPSLVTLITCDPPGSNVNRLVIQAEQINPMPDSNRPSTATTNSAKPEILAGSPESLWRRLLNSILN